MTIVTVKAKPGAARTPEKVDALMQELRRVVAAHLEVPAEKVLVVFEEHPGALYYDGGPQRPDTNPRSTGRPRGVKV